MDSNNFIETFLPGDELTIQVDKMYENILIVMNKSRSMKGFLMPVTKKNDSIMEKFLMKYKQASRSFTSKKPINLPCMTDSTMYQDVIESSPQKCLSPDKINGKRNRELEKLTHHGFNETTLKMKNDSSRRSKHNVTTKEVKEEHIIVDDDEICNVPKNFNPIISRPKGLDKFNNKRDSLLATRNTAARALKTRANEKIIDLATRRKSLKLSVGETHNVECVDQDLPHIATTEDDYIKELSPRVSDESTYDFIDEECEYEPSKSLQIDLKSHCYSKKRNSGLDSESITGVTYHKQGGVQFSVNDVVWAKIPGYPYWPAHISEFDCSKCRINWIGWDQKSFLPIKSLFHFKAHFATKYSPKLKSVKYKAAIALTCKELGLNLEDLLAEADKNSISPDTFSRNRLINLDEIFPCRENTRSLSDLALSQKSCSDDDGTDEEEKARSALITAESIETNSKLSDMIARVE